MNAAQCFTRSLVGLMFYRRIMRILKNTNEAYSSLFLSKRVRGKGLDHGSYHSHTIIS